MSTNTRERVETLAVRPFPVRSRLIAIVAVVAMIAGFGSLAGGIFGAAYTWNQAVVENITTPDDARIADAPVRGPFTMWAQSDIITHHQLDRTEGLRYAEMPRQIPLLDDAGAPVMDEAGEPVLVSNEVRLSWINATALTTALNLGIIAYAFSAFAIVVGVAMIGVGWVLWTLRRSLAITA